MTMHIRRSPTWSSDGYISDVSFNYNQRSLLSASDGTCCRTEDMDDRFVFINGKTRTKTHPRLMLGCIPQEGIDQEQMQKKLAGIFRVKKSDASETRDYTISPVWKSWKDTLEKQYEAWNLSFVYDMVACSNAPRTAGETVHHAPPQKSNPRRNQRHRRRARSQSRSRSRRSNSKPRSGVSLREAKH